MKIYLETKDRDNHRIVFAASSNGKGIYFGEFCRRKDTCYATLHSHLYDLGWRGNIDQVKAKVIERPYKPGSFARNAGPKKKSTTKAKK